MTFILVSQVLVTVVQNLRDAEHPGLEPIVALHNRSLH